MNLETPAMQQDIGARPIFRPLEQFTAAVRRRARVVLTDIDDTLTDRGRLPAIAYHALERLREKGFIVVPVTGRPAGWCDLIARLWPVDGVIGENGAFYFRYDNSARRMIRSYVKPADQRALDRQRLDAARAAILAKVAGSAVASDQAYREADLAIDFAEDVTPLSQAAVNLIVEIFEAHGAIAKISSIHVNGWFGGYDKLTTSLRMLAAEFGIDAEADREAVVFVGDSPNDAPMFGYFPNSAGVANVLRFRDILTASPQWITRNPGARGFAELADRLCE